MRRLLSHAFIRDGALAGAANLLANVGSLAYYAVAARVLGPEAGGLALALIAAALLVSVIANIAGVALTANVARLHADDRRGQIRVVATRVFVAWAVFSVVLFGVTVVFRRSGEALFHLRDSALLYETAAIVSTNAILLLVRAFVQAVGRFDAYSWSNVFEVLFKIAAVVAIAGVPSLRMTIGALAVALGISAIGTASFVARYWAGVPPEAPAFAENGGVRSLLGAFTAIALMSFSDGIIARHTLAAYDAGLYNAAALAGRALMSALGFLPVVILARVGHDRDRKAGFGLLAYAVTAAACVMAIALFAIAPRAILAAIGGSAYLAGAPLVALYGIAAAALAMTNVVVSYRIGRGARFLGRVLLAVAAGEIGAMLWYHPSAASLVAVVIAGHTVALLASVATDARLRFSLRSAVTTETL